MEKEKKIQSVQAEQKAEEVRSTKEVKSTKKVIENKKSKKTKKYEELTITDDFMFGKVMQEPERCRKLLEIILDVKIREIEFADEQNTMSPDYEAKGIRLDIYLEDDGNTVYCVEMQASRKPFLSRRTRYYQSVIDINLLEKGAEYRSLKKSYVIFICTFDLFGAGRYIYHFENLCREDPSIRLEDGTEKIFLNTKGNREDIPPELENLLKYFETKIPRDDYTEELDKAVEAARRHEEWRREFMKWHLDRVDAKEEGREEGIQEGRKEGRIEGIQAFILDNVEEGKTGEVIIAKLMNRFGLDREQAEEYYDRFAVAVQPSHL
ncbi:MAG: Rpn family recombination-promoting nuclease/putative transposase [Roseburia sp.]|nr:Rpn family recombination-promoting nuclease/putative transposase [Roseburia sp.]